MENLHTERLLLREVQADDAHSLLKIWSNPKVTKYMNIQSMTHVNQALEMITMFQQLHQSNQANRYSIIHKESQKIMGSCGFNYLDFENDRGEIGYELDDLFWGNGYMSEALGLLINYGFTAIKLNRIEAKVEPQNVASIRLLKRIGFTEEGLLRQYEKSKGQYIDLKMFSLLKEEGLDFKG